MRLCTAVKGTRGRKKTPPFIMEPVVKINMKRRGQKALALDMKTDSFTGVRDTSRIIPRRRSVMRRNGTRLNKKKDIMPRAVGGVNTSNIGWSTNG